jgi:hypothetical protein
VSPRGRTRQPRQEVVAKVREAADTLSKTGDVAQFNQKQSPWVWKDTYIFVEACDKKVQVAHPIKPELVGKDTLSIMDTRGKNVFPRDFAMQRRSLQGSGSNIGGRSPARRKARVRSAIS